MASVWSVVESPQDRTQVQIPPVAVEPIASSERAALLEAAGNFDTLHRKNDFFGEGIGTIYRSEIAELQSFRFRPGNFTPAIAEQWLEEWGLKPVLFVEGDTT